MRRLRIYLMCVGVLAVAACVSNEGIEAECERRWHANRSTATGIDEATYIRNCVEAEEILTQLRSG